MNAINAERLLNFWINELNEEKDDMNRKTTQLVIEKETI